MKKEWSKEYKAKGIPSSFRKTPSGTVAQFVEFLKLKNITWARVPSEKKCPETGLNRRHRDFQSLALPTELSGQII